MKRISLLLFSVLLLFTCVYSNDVQAKYPMVEFFFVKFDGVNGLKRAEVAIKKTGFKLISGTYEVEDRVGVLGNYTAAIGLSTEYPTAVVFVVSGPNYKKCHKYGRELQRHFVNYKP